VASWLAEYSMVAVLRQRTGDRSMCTKYSLRLAGAGGPYRQSFTRSEAYVGKMLMRPPSAFDVIASAIYKASAD
jgi:hypothetical protein